MAGWRSESLLFGCLQIDEDAAGDCAAPAGERARSALQRATESAYRELFALLDETGYPGLFRAWNYFRRRRR